MNVFEALFLLATMFGGALLAALLTGPESPLFAAALPIGALAGPFLVLGPLFAIGWLQSTYEEYQTDRSLRVHFGLFQSKDREWLWEDVEQHLRVGQVVRGRVATRLDGDLYADVGLGFPARLRGWNAADRVAFESARGGDPIEARVLAIDSARRVVELAQR